MATYFIYLLTDICLQHLLHAVQINIVQFDTLLFSLISLRGKSQLGNLLDVLYVSLKLFFMVSFCDILCASMS